MLGRVGGGLFLRVCGGADGGNKYTEEEDERFHVNMGLRLALQLLIIQVDRVNFGFAANRVFDSDCQFFCPLVMLLTSR